MPDERSGDPFNLPPYVRESLEAWCALYGGDARKGSRVDLEERYGGAAPDYDPYRDWEDEPFPEELE